MNNGHKTIVAMLAVVAVLLALNLIAGGERAANAQANSALGACCLAGGVCDDGYTAGACEAIGGLFLGDGTTCVAGICNDEACCYPGDTCDDGPALWCINVRGGDPQGPGTRCQDVDCSDLPCPGDANDDRVIDFDDLLVVLDGWGPCD